MRWTCSLVLLLALGCEPGPAFVAIDLRTDMVVSREVDNVALTIDDGEPMELELDEAADYLSGVRIAELPMLEPGPHMIEVNLRRSTTSRLRRPIALNVDRDLVVTAVMTRDCRGVECPSESSPNAAACLAGTCIPASCLPELGTECPTGLEECIVDADCTTVGACARGICSEGTCIFDAVDDNCSAERPLCDPDVGCEDNSGRYGLWSITGTPDTVYFGFSASGSPTVDGERFSTNGSSDLYIQAREPDGQTVRWTRQLGVEEHEFLEDLETMASGDLLLGGSVYSPDAFEGITLDPATSGEDGLVAVLDQTTGDPIWATSLLGDGGKNFVTSVAADAGDVIYALICHEADITVGSFNLPAVREQEWGLVAFAPGVTAGTWDVAWALPIPSGDPGQLAAGSDGVYLVGGADTAFTVGGTTEAATAERTGFVASIGSDGTVTWLRTIGGAAWATLEDVAVDDMDRAYVIGEIDGSAQIGGDMLVSEGDDILLVGLMADSTARWSRTYGGAGSERGYRIDFDGTDLTWVGRSDEPFMVGADPVGAADGNWSLVYGTVQNNATVVGAGTVTPEGTNWPRPWAIAVTSSHVCAVGDAPQSLEPIFYRGSSRSVHLSCAAR